MLCYHTVKPLGLLVDYIIVRIKMLYYQLLFHRLDQLMTLVAFFQVQLLPVQWTKRYGTLRGTTSSF